MNEYQQLVLDRQSLGMSQNQAAMVLGNMSQRSWLKLEKGIEQCVIHDDIKVNTQTMKDWVRFLFSNAAEDSNDGPIVVPVFNNNSLFIDFLETILPPTALLDYYIQPYQQYAMMCNLLLDNVEFVLIETEEQLSKLLELDDR
jgi:hypothetical protein